MIILIYKLNQVKITIPKYFGFYFKHSLSKLKNEWLVIICISLSLSMVTGLSYFFKAAQKHQFENSFFTMTDFEVTYYPKFDNGGLIPKMDYYQYFHDSETKIKNSIDNSPLDLNGTYKFGLFGWGAGYVVPQYWDYLKLEDTSGILDYVNEINGSNVQFALFEQDFYRSQRFNDYFKIIAGTTPEAENEVLMDYNYAKKFNLKVGDITNITVLVGRTHDLNPPVGHLIPFQSPPVKLVGTYLPIKEDYRISLQRLKYSYTYFDYLANRSFPEFLDEVDTPAIFSAKNFSIPGFSHPFQLLYQNINATNFYRNYLVNDNLRCGYIIAYNRDHIQFNTLNKDKTIIAQQAWNTSLSMPFEVNFVDYLALQLNMVYLDLMESHLIIQVLNIPIILFSILITQNFVASNKKKINEELLLLRLRSVPLKTIKWQIVISAFIKGLICMILGLLGGFITFFAFENFIGVIFFDTEKILLTPYFEWNNVLSSFILGTIMNGIAIIPKLIQARKPKYADIAASLSQDDLAAKYDERLFLGKKERELTEINEYDSDSKKFFKHYNIKKKITKKKVVYSDFYDDEKKKLQFLPYLLMGVGIIPIILNILIVIRYSTTASDSLVDIVNIMTYSLQAFQFLTLFGMAFFVAGLVRLIVIQRPSLFARLSKEISKLFVRKYDHIVGLELVRQKKWSGIITYLAIFASLLITTNITFNSQFRYETLERNMYIGSDFRVEMQNPSFSSLDQINSFEQQILNYSDTDANPYIKDLTTCFVDINCTSYNYFNDRMIENSFNAYILNSTDYLNILEKNEKPLPYPDFKNDIMELTSKNTMSSNFSLPAYVSSRFLVDSNSIIGDKVEIHHKYSNNNTTDLQTQILHIEIIGVLDFVPGLYNNSNFIESSILLDIGNLNQSENLLHGKKLIQILSFNSNFDVESETEYDNLRMKYSAFCSNIRYDISDPDWDDTSKAILSIQYGTSGFFGLEYLNFTLIGFLLVIELSLTIILINRENSHFNGLLLARGIGRKKIFQMELTETFIVFLIAFLVGSIIGIGFSWILIKVGQIIIQNIMGSTFSSSTSLPIFCDIGNLLSIFSLLIVSSIAILVINYLVSKTETIEQTMEKEMI
ncbi:FtsX-like permease family protein [Candidatus Lokiarchaeum ossiferum]|uniref:FtsX-like permease family protein n=1 Tax=Candidatus Lokiarchaeum ossiferum TaxID=2951803 RepID=UPI00352F09AD